eukprot:scaffold24738_cov74-Cyclotella_meneghiniana.AAC.14
MASAPRMEQVFFHTHSKISHSILRHSSHRFRSTVEHFVLGLAVCGFCVVLLSHVTFVHRGDLLRGADECIPSIQDVCEGGGGISVYSVLITLIGSVYNWVTSSSGINFDITRTIAKKQIPLSCLKSIPGFSEDADMTHILIIDGRYLNGTGSRAFTLHTGREHYNETVVSGMPLTMTDQVSSSTHQYSSCLITDTGSKSVKNTKRREKRGEKSLTECPMYITALLSQYGYVSNFTQHTTQENEFTNNLSTIIYSYSHAKGILLLSPSLKQAHNISTQFVIASSSHVNCFGEPFVQNIVFSLVGSDTVVLNWIFGLQQHANNDKRIKYVYNWKTGREWDLDLFDMDYYAFSSSSSSASRYGIDLSRYPIIRNYMSKVHNHPLYRLVRFLTFKVAVFLSTLFIFFLTTSLVSFTFQETQDRMLEFTFQLQTRVRARLPLGVYEGDKFLAFVVLSMVWIAEVFSAISCPVGFTYASLASTSLFLVHTMLFFLNRYELPAINARLVTPEMPRMIRTREMNFRDDVRSHSNIPNLGVSNNTNHTEPLSNHQTITSEQRTLPQNPISSYVQAASTSLQSIRSLASGNVDGEEDEDSFMAYVGDNARSSLSMSVENT